MTNFRTFRSAFAAVLVLATASAAQEKKIQRSELPLAVEKTVAAQSAGATIRGFSQEKEHGQTYYEAEMTVDGHSKDVLIDASGKVVEVEEQVALDSLPAAVKDGLQARAGKGKLLTVESIASTTSWWLTRRKFRRMARKPKSRLAPTANRWTTKNKAFPGEKRKPRAGSTLPRLPLTISSPHSLTVPA